MANARVQELGGSAVTFNKEQQLPNKPTGLASVLMKPTAEEKARMERPKSPPPVPQGGKNRSSGSKRPEAKKPQPPKPPMGESGSGFTKLKSGKLVKNKRPKARAVQERQSRNYRVHARDEFVKYAKEAYPGRKPTDDPPTEDEHWDKLLSNLEYAKVYRGYVKASRKPSTCYELPAFRKVVPAPVVRSGRVNVAETIELACSNSPWSEYQDFSRPLYEKYLGVSPQSTDDELISEEESEKDSRAQKPSFSTSGC